MPVKRFYAGPSFGPGNKRTRTTPMEEQINAWEAAEGDVEIKRIDSSPSGEGEVVYVTYEKVEKPAERPPHS